MRRHASFEEFWETTLDLSRNFHDAVLSQDRSRSRRSRRRCAERLRPYTASDGTIAIPARTLVATASA